MYVPFFCTVHILPMKRHLLLLSATALLLISSCKITHDPNPAPSIKQVLAEDFEQGNKQAYATGTVNLKSGHWTLNDALIGNLAADRKNELFSIRMRNTGSIAMNFDLLKGADRIMIYHAVYGNDAASTWQLETSTNSGDSYQKRGETVTSSKPTLDSVVFQIKENGPVRFSITKLSGGTARINFDDIKIYGKSAETNAPAAPPVVVEPVKLTLTENLEQGTKAGYAAGAVALGSGSWTLDDALIGKLADDRKNGISSIRMRNTGSAHMNFDLIKGADRIVVYYAVYGSDPASTWEMQTSGDSGNLYVKTGETVTASKTTLDSAVFSVKSTSRIRFQIKKLSGGTARINFDNIKIYGTSADTSSSSGGTTTPPPTATTYDNLLFGNPSNAQNALVFNTNYLMDKGQYMLSYNNQTSCPNWVSWYVGSTALGSAQRQDDFRADMQIPGAWYPVQNTSYSGSGFDRGHNCPSADRTLTVAANSTTFLMSNMIPQAPQNNQQTWNNLEQYIRNQVTAGNECYVVMGSYGTGGTGSAGYAEKIDNGRINVPKRVWKMVVVIPYGDNDLSRVNAGTRVIAVDTPNDNSISTDWKPYITSVDAIEAATGLDLLSALPANVQAAIEAKTDTGI